MENINASLWTHNSKWVPNRVLDPSQEYVAHWVRGRPVLRWNDTTAVIERVVSDEVYIPVIRSGSRDPVPFFIPSSDNWW